MKNITLTAYDEVLGKWIYTKTYRSCAWDEMAWLQSACLIKRFLAGQVVAMFGPDVLRGHEITFEGIDEKGRHIRIPITEKMLGV